MARTIKSQLLWLERAANTVVRILFFLLECIVAGLGLSLYFDILSPQTHAILFAQWVSLGVLLAALIIAAKTRRFRFLFTSESNRFHLKTVAVLLTGIVLYYSIEKWQGKRLWAQMLREMAASGETPGMTKPEPVPDDQDMAKAPIFLPLTKFEEIEDGAVVWLDQKGYKRLVALRLPEKASQTGNAPWRLRKSVDYSKLPTNLLASLEPLRADLEEVRQASLRPYASLPHFWSQGTKAPQDTPWDFVWRMSKAFELRAGLELRVGKTDEALEDVLCSLRLANHVIQSRGNWLADASDSERVIRNAMQPIWEGVCSHQWNDRQLEALLRQLESIQLLSATPVYAHKCAWQYMDAVNQLIPVAPWPPKPAWPRFASDTAPLQFIRAVYPKGWSFQDQVMIHEWIMSEAKIVDASQNRVHPEALAQELPVYSQDPFSLIFILPRLKELRVAIPQQTSLGQTMLDHAKTACALERCRIANGAYPDKLESLAPRFIATLPNDIFTGEPFGYQHQGGDEFTIYSIGWNMKDDGGKTEFDGNRPGANSEINYQEGDWVWGFPEPQKKEAQ